MHPDAQLQRMLNQGLVAIIRARSADELVSVARALHEGGIDVIEVTSTVPQFLEVLSQIRQDLGDDILLGAGTILDAESAEAALQAGAEFLVSPTLQLDVVEVARRSQKLVMPGALTPTEILTAWQAGASLVKVFPADIGGPAYLRALKGPLPQVRLMATGGVSLHTLRDYVTAGAEVVGVGGALIEPTAVANSDFFRIRELASRFADLMRAVRSETGRP